MEQALARSPNVRLKAERELRGWSQKYVAEQLGADHYYLSRWERGTISPSPYYRQKLCTLFGKDARVLGLLEEPANEGQAQIPPYSEGAIHDPAIPLLIADEVSLVGREALLHQLKQRLCSGKGGAGTALSGLPGVGKTTLAATLAQDPEVREHFSGGVLWAGLGPIPNVLGLLSRWGSVFSLPTAETSKLSTLEDWARALRAAIGTRRILVVIDDAWRIEAALAFKVGGSGCAYLVTTRFPQIALHLAPDQTTVVSELDEQESLALLSHLAPDVVRREPAQALALAQAVGGLPLALTIMGRYLRIQAYSRQPRRIRAALERLRDTRERLLLTETQAVLERSPSLPTETPLSLQTVIEVSDQQLPEPAQRVLRALSAFPAKPNSFTEEAAAAVCAMPVSVLDNLTDAGLLESSEPGRYTLHQIIADYARIHLEGTEAHARLAIYFADYAQAHRKDYEVLEQESSNLFAALQAASKANYPASLVQCITAFAPFLLARGLYVQAEDFLELAQQAARSHNDRAGLAEILLSTGRVQFNHAAYNQAEAFLQEGLALARQGENQEHLCQFLNWLGTVARYRGSYSQAEAFHQEGLTLARQSGDLEQISALLTGIGTDASEQGHYEQAETYFQEGVDLARWLDNRERLCDLLVNSSLVAYFRGDYSLGDRLSLEALDIARKMSYRPAIVTLLGNLGGTALEQGNHAQAVGYLQESLAMARQTEHHEMICINILNLGQLTTEQGDYAQATTYLQEALQMVRQTGRHVLLCGVLDAWGELQLKQQQISLAETAFHEMMEIASEGNQTYQAAAYYGLARVAASQGDSQEAQRLGQESFQLFETIGNRMASQVRAWLQTLPEEFTRRTD